MSGSGDLPSWSCSKALWSMRMVASQSDFVLGFDGLAVVRTETTLSII